MNDWFNSISATRATHVKIKPVLLALLWVAIAFCAITNSAPSWADQSITSIRIGGSPSDTRVVFDLSGPAAYRVFTLENPDRVVIDFPNARNRAGRVVPPRETAVTSLRSAVQSDNAFRIVLDLKQPSSVKNFMVPPDRNSGQRLVIDISQAGSAGQVVASRPAVPSVVPVGKPNEALAGATGVAGVAGAAGAAGRVTAPYVSASQERSPSQNQPPNNRAIAQTPSKHVNAHRSAPRITPSNAKVREVIVAIDAGHGGQDPGAIGPSGIREKDITLSIARTLQAELNRQEGIKAHLVRSGDYFVPLASRRDIARNRIKADLFVSIHADAAHNRKARGASVFALSRNGATSSLAAMLADRENKADVMGGVLTDKDATVASVIADLALEGAMEHSIKVGSKVLHELGGTTVLHKRHIEKAGFAVLKSADFPSILVETGFISNPTEESHLRNLGHQDKLSKAITRGVMGYFMVNPPPGTILAQKYGSGGSALAYAPN
ncbi:N-acetylmuramoyl-L-alanine amidase [gamma proteobacterium HdN1]|nr:N-acetylmuramoyl-L-alanine amidase [gamma proteobacterium HdN1]